jgi:hypothetical protein
MFCVCVCVCVSFLLYSQNTSLIIVIVVVWLWDALFCLKLGRKGSLLNNTWFTFSLKSSLGQFNN